MIPSVQSVAGRVLVLYSYCQRAEVLSYFVANGMSQRENVDYWLIVNGAEKVVPGKWDNVIYRENVGHDFAAWREGFRRCDVKLYDYFVCLNDTMKGPYCTERWMGKFTCLLDDSCLLSGVTINYYNCKVTALLFKEELLPHVQSMLWCTNRKGLGVLWSLLMKDSPSDKGELIVEKEIGLSLCLLKAGYDITCILPEFRGRDHRDRSRWLEYAEHNYTALIRSRGDPWYVGNYYGRTLVPADTIFFKINRLDDGLLVQTEVVVQKEEKEVVVQKEVTDQKPIYGFYTISTNKRRSLETFKQQMSRLQSSGLAEAMTKFYVIVIGEQNVEIEQLSFKKKITLLSADNELLALTTMRELAASEEFNCFYFHCKSCSEKDAYYQPMSDWSNLLEHFIIDAWEVIPPLLEQYDTVGVNPKEDPAAHYDGNFWWARSSYLRLLSDPRTKELAYYSALCSPAEVLQHARFLACDSKVIDPEFVELYSSSGVANLNAFIEKYGVDWLWYKRFYRDLNGLTMEQLIAHWRTNGKAERRIPDSTFHHKLWMRVNAQFWILSGGGKNFSLYASNVLHYTSTFSPTIYPGAKVIAVLLTDGGCVDMPLFVNSSRIEYRLFINITDGVGYTKKLKGAYPHAVYSSFDAVRLGDYADEILGSGLYYDLVVV